MPSTSTTTTLTPRPRVAKVMTCALTDRLGNAASAHRFGLQQAELGVIPLTPGGVVRET